MKTSELAESIARELSNKIASREIIAGEPLRAQALANSFGVSRSPIREALLLLAEAGMVEQKPNRGFYVIGQKTDDVASMPNALLMERESPYQRVANDWRKNDLPEEVTEVFLRERYSITKTQAQEILTRAVRDGWAERKAGYGWRLLNVAKSPESFRQIYEFRMVIEPAAMLAPDYAVVPSKIEELRAIQQRMLDHDISHLPVEQLLETGANFHEELIKFSNNSNFYTALLRVNQMRRLLEYRAAANPKRFVEQCTQHLAILELLARGEILEASFVMKKHLGGALTSKARLIDTFDRTSQ